MCEGQIEWTDGLTEIIVHTCGSCKISIPSLQNIVVIDDFDLHIFQYKIDIVILGRFLHNFKFSHVALSRFCIPVAGQGLNKQACNLIQIYHVVPCGSKVMSLFTS